jgi:hypothetical protein
MWHRPRLRFPAGTRFVYAESRAAARRQPINGKAFRATAGSPPATVESHRMGKRVRTKRIPRSQGRVAMANCTARLSLPYAMCSLRRRENREEISHFRAKSGPESLNPLSVRSPYLRGLSTEQAELADEDWPLRRACAVAAATLSGMMGSKPQPKELGSLHAPLSDVLAPSWRDRTTCWPDP